MASSAEDDQPWHRIHATKSIWGEMTCLQIMHTTLLEIVYGFFAFFGVAVSLIQMFQIGNLRHCVASLEGKRPTEGRSGSPANKVGSE